MSVIVFVNGRRAQCVPALDRGLHYGDGLFETLRIDDARAPLLEYHLDRLLLGCKKLKFPLPRRATLRDEIKRVARTGSRARASEPHGVVIKVLLTRGLGERGYRAPRRPKPMRILVREPATRPMNLAAPVAVRVCRTRAAVQPQLAGLKTLNRLDSVLARGEWRDSRIFEGLMLDDAGHIVCGTMSNIFCVEGSVLSTPRILAAGIAGVMRRWIIERAPVHGLRVCEREISMARLLRAEEIFLSNAVIGIRSVARIAQHLRRAPLRTSAADRLRAAYAAFAAS